MQSFRVALLVAALAPQAACLAGGPTNNATQLQGGHPGCELTMQNNTFAGMCGQITLRNSGSLTMQGWSIGFDLPADGRLVNAWNAVFTATGSHVTVRPSDAQVALPPGAAVSLGYCASGAALNVDLAAGLCGDANADVAPSGAPAAEASSDAAGFTDSFTTLDANRWVAVSGSADGCNFAGGAVAGDPDGLSLQIGSVGDTRQCAQLQSIATVPSGHLEAQLQAATNSHTVLSLALQGATAEGVQAVAVDLSADAPNQVVLSGWLDGVRTSSTLAVAFDTTAAPHSYGIGWGSGALVWTIDGQVVATRTTDVPRTGAHAHVVLSGWVGTADGGVDGQSNGRGKATCRELSFAP